MTVLSSAVGTRMDCDRCGEHVVTRRHSIAALRLATGYVRLDGDDYCPRCIAATTGAAGDAPPDGPAAA